MYSVNDKDSVLLIFANLLEEDKLDIELSCKYWKKVVAKIACLIAFNISLFYIRVCGGILGHPRLLCRDNWIKE